MEGRLLFADSSSGTYECCDVVLECATAQLRVTRPTTPVPLTIQLETQSSLSGLMTAPASRLLVDSDVAFTIELTGSDVFRGGLLTLEAPVCADTAKSDTESEGNLPRFCFVAHDAEELRQWTKALEVYTGPAVMSKSAAAETGVEDNGQGGTGAVEDEDGCVKRKEGNSPQAVESDPQGGIDQYLCGLEEAALAFAVIAAKSTIDLSPHLPHTPQPPHEPRQQVQPQLQQHQQHQQPKVPPLHFDHLQQQQTATTTEHKMATTGATTEREQASPKWHAGTARKSQHKSVLATTRTSRSFETTTPPTPTPTPTAATTPRSPWDEDSPRRVARRGEWKAPPLPTWLAHRKQIERERAARGAALVAQRRESSVFPGRAVPECAVQRIMDHLSLRDLARASGVSRAWRAACNEPSLWATFAMELGVGVPRKAEGSSSSNVYKQAVAQFKSRCAGLTQKQLVEAVYRPMLLKRLRDKDSSGMCGWLHVRGENLLMKWKRRWAAVWDNCLVVYRSQKPDERPLLLVPLRGDVRVDTVKKNVFRLHSVEGVLLTLKLAIKPRSQQAAASSPPLSQQSSALPQTGSPILTASAASRLAARATQRLSKSAAIAAAPEEQLVLVEEGRGVLFLSTDKAAASRQWRKTLHKNVVLSVELFGMQARAVLLRTPLFGVPLGALMARQREMLAEAGAQKQQHEVPLFLERILQHLRATALDEEGLFRLSGSAERVVELRHRLESGEAIDFDQEDPHTLAAVVKMFLRELPEPLVPQELNSFISNALSTGGSTGGVLCDQTSTAEVLAAVRMCLDDLPRDNTALLKCLALFLNDVVAHAAKNKMDQTNLFIVFIPTLRIVPAILSLAMAHPDELFSP